MCVTRFGSILVNKIVIDIERCKGCYLCIEACPRDILEPGDKMNIGGCYPVRQKPDGDCTGCTLCARVCPDAAIEVYVGVADDECEA